MGFSDNRKVWMKQDNEMPVQINSPAPRFRYWVTPPESITLKVADIEPFVPKASWKTGFPPDLTFDIPADRIFAKNVPRIPLSLLAELLPDYITSSDGLVKLPAKNLAASYRLIEHSEELPPEIPPEPVVADLPGIDSQDAVAAEPAGEEPPPFVTLDPPALAEERAFSGEPETPLTAANDPAPISGPTVSPEEPTPTPPTVSIPALKATPAVQATGVTASNFPPKRTGSFVGLPLFRRKTVPVAAPRVIPPPPVVVEAAPEQVAEPIEQIPVAPTPSQEPSIPESAFEYPSPPFETPVHQPAEETIRLPDLPSPAPVQVLRTEHFPKENKGQEIVEQEPLQALFLTEETMTVGRVIELCGGLPGINSCVLAHGSVVVASHNVPDGVDLVSMSAHAADMLKAMRDSSARMGVGTVPAVTLHTEKGVISFFNREDLTMLVFHKDRGFIPGVREKMAAVLGELTKARLTLPVGDEQG